MVCPLLFPIVPYCSLLFLLFLLLLLLSPIVETREAPVEWGGRFATLGARLIHEETSRVPTGKGTGVLYKLRAEGLPTDRTSYLWRRTLGGHIAAMPQALRIDDSGHVIEENGAELVFGLRNMLEGEPIEYALTSSDKRK